MNTLGTFVVIILSLAVGGAAGYYGRRLIAESRIRGAEEEASRILEEASKEAEAKKKETLLEAKEEIHRHRQEAEKDIRERRRELDRMERRLLQKEEALDRKTDSIEKKDQVLRDRERILKNPARFADDSYSAIKRTRASIGLTSEEAKELLLANVEQQIRQETAIMIKTMESEARKKQIKELRT